MSKKNWEKILTDSWVSNNLNLSESEAEKQLISSEFEIKKIMEDKENNDQLNAAKDIVKELNAGYAAAAKYEKAKIEFLLEKLENIRAAKAR